MKISRTRKVLVSSFIMILFSLLTFTFTTFAWFSDSVSSSENIITMGNLDAEMYWTNNLNSGVWNNIEDPKHNTVFSHNNYEPGYTEVRYLKIVNTGSLAFEYDLSLLPLGEVGKLAEVIDVYYLSNVTDNIPTRDLKTMNKKGTIKSSLGKTLSGVQCLLPEGVNDLIHHEHEIIVAIALQMQTSAGNEYQGESIGKGFSIRLVATQYNYEKDLFGDNYDSNATFPESLSVGISTTNNKVNKATSIRSDLVEVVIPKGVEVEAGINSLTLTVNEMEETGSNVVLEGDQVATSLDVHVHGVSENNTVPMIITINSVASKYLNKGNIELYHVEDGQTIQMTEVNSKNDLTKHNQFYYDSASGAFMIALASFSEICAVEKTINAWKGDIDYSWYNTTDTEFKIFNGDQLAGLSAIVGGMTAIEDKNGNTLLDGNNNPIIDNFLGKTVKLIADINLGSKEANNPIFYPIGYYNNTGSYTKASGTAGVVSGRKPFEGTFDGNGHTISNFYQNTWEMFGDYNSGYTGNPNHYKDGMGLFAFVRNGLVTNLHIDNFSCDSEFGISGVVAAYANNSTFKNIAITNCTPGVYNNANGGIVGYVGSYYSNSYESTGKEYNDGDDNVVFSNITVDNTNTIRALWGTWDGCCAGILGRYDSKSKIIMEHCYVAAKMDVFNDVCGNYQYYWYRYSAMLVGSIEVMTTDKNENIVPDISKFEVSNVYVHFDTWNDYYYCELVANSQASYTHDYQMSRLTEVDSVNVNNKTYTIGEETFAIPTSGRVNYVVVDKEEVDGNGKIIRSTEKATCYHFVDGQLWIHDKAGKESVNGVEVYVEDKQHIYLPFNQIYQGWGWGVKNIPFTTGMDGVTELDKLAIKSIDKFTVNANTDEFSAGDTITLGELFGEVSKPAIQIFPLNIQVGITYVDELNQTRKVDAKFTRNTTELPDGTIKWQDGTITLPEGEYDKVYVTIQDYICCNPITIELNVKQPEKFESKFTNERFTYRVGNGNEISLGSLFNEKGSISVIDENVIVKVNGKEVTLSNEKNWEDKKIQITETGIVSVTISDGYSKECIIEELEVVAAMNATSATSAKTYNVVLLNDCGFSSLEVSGGYTLYGNGFTMTCGSDSAALDTGYAFVTLDNGTLDNVQIVTPNFDYAVLYKSNMTESGNRSETTDRTRYYNVKSGVMVSGNSQILNSRISGARAAVNVTGGNILIDNSRIELGAVANILVGSANSITLRDVTLVQKPTASTYDSSKTLMGFSVLFTCDDEGNAAPVTLEGDFIQNAWACEEYKKYVPSKGQDIVDKVLKQTNYKHNINGTDFVNLGFAYMPGESQTTIEKPNNIKDNRNGKNSVLYEMADIEIVTLLGKTTVYVYSYKNTNGTADSFKTESEYKPNKQGDNIVVNYSDTTNGLEQGKSFGTNGWVYELNVDLDKASGYKLDFSKLSMTVNGTTVTDYKVNGSAKPTTPVAVIAGGTPYILTATIDGKVYTATFKVTGTETSKESPSKISGPTTAGFGVAKSYGSDWSGAADVLTGVKVKYWSVAENKYVEFDFSDFTVPGKAGKLNGTNNYWEYTPDNNDFTLKVTNTVAIHSGKSVYGMPIRGTDGKLYFTISSTNGYVGSGTTSRAVTMQYEFTDNNGGEKLTFTHTFNISYNKDEQYSYSDFCSGKLTILENSGSSGGCVTPESLITLADGSQVRVDSLVGNEQLLVWNLETGKLDSAPIMFIDNDPVANYKVVNLHFSDDTTVKVIYEHGFWDYNLGKYIYLDENASEYIGHWFAKQNGDTLEKVQLVDVVIEEEMTSAWSPVTVGHLCYFVNGMLSMPGGVEGLFNIFDVNPETMTYDFEAMQKDIETYGLYTYEEVNALAPLSREMFEQCGGAYLKISISKGNMTEEDLIYMIERYRHFYTSLVALGLVL